MSTNISSEDFKKNIQVLEDLLAATKDFVFSTQEKLRHKLDRFSSPRDSLQLGSSLLKIFPDKREESISDKVAWIIAAEFLSDDSERAKFQNAFLLELQARRKFPIFQASPREFHNLAFSAGVGSVRRELHHEGENGRSARRTDVALGSHCNLQESSAILGIEIKVNDRDYLKSEEAYAYLKRDFPNAKTEYFILLPADRIAYLFNNGSQTDLDDKHSDVCDRWPHSIPFVTWEDFLHALRNSTERIDGDSKPIADAVLGLFLGSIECSVLGFDLDGIRSFRKECSEKISLSNYFNLKKYLDYRM